MIPYFVLLGIWIVGTVQFASRRESTYERLFYAAALAATTVMVGLREQVGGDWVTYQEMYDDISFLSLRDAFRITEPAYAFLNWLSAKFDGGVYFANLGCAIVFMLGLSSLARRQPQPWLAMMVAIPYLVIVVGMGYTRQAAAIGVVCWAIAHADDDPIWRMVAKIAFAALFHKTAILFLPILLLPTFKRNSLTAIGGGVAFLILAAIALRGSSDRLVTNYVNSNYQSSGAAIRIAMNVAAAGLFFLFRKRFLVSETSRLIWTAMAGLAILSVVGLVYASSSVGIDRLALFLIPLQIFVYGNLPYMPHLMRNTRVFSTILVLIYGFAVQYVYFVHGTFSWAWLPYRNVLFVTDDALGD